MELNETQKLLQSTARSWMERLQASGAIRSLFRGSSTFDADLYRELVDLGWIGLMIPEEFGGSGASLTDAAVVFEELGRGPFPGPAIITATVGAQCLLEGANADQRAAMLGAVSSGASRLCLALGDSGVRFDPGSVTSQLTEDGSDVVVTGAKRFVLDADGATDIICTVREPGNGGISLVLVPTDAPGVTLQRVDAFASSLWHVGLDGVRVDTSRIIGTRGSGWNVIERAAMNSIPVISAYQVGALQQIFDMTVEYTRDRVVFGQPIGRFQRVQDHVVDLSIQMDSARCMTEEVLGHFSETGECPPEKVHELKAMASEGYLRGCEFSHMVFAGPGTALEHPLVAHSLVSKTLFAFLGDPHFHKAKMIDYVLAKPLATS